MALRGGNTARDVTASVYVPKGSTVRLNAAVEEYFTDGGRIGRCVR
jgi:hypothetical protein